MKEKLLKLVTSDGFSQQTPSFLVYIKKFLNPGIWRALFKEYILDNIEPALISFIDEYEQTESPSTTTPIRFCAKTPVTHLKKKRSGGIWPAGECLYRAKLQRTETTKFNTTGTHQSDSDMFAHVYYNIER